MRSRFAEIPFCSSFTVLPAPALVLLNHVLKIILCFSVRYMSSFMSCQSSENCDQNQKSAPDMYNKMATMLAISQNEIEELPSRSVIFCTQARSPLNGGKWSVLEQWCQVAQQPSFQMVANIGIKIALILFSCSLNPSAEVLVQILLSIQKPSNPVGGKIVVKRSEPHPKAEAVKLPRWTLTRIMNANPSWKENSHLF